MPKKKCNQPNIIFKKCLETIIKDNNEDNIISSLRKCDSYKKTLRMCLDRTKPVYLTGP